MTIHADRLKRITVEEGKCGDRPCIRGQRIRVSDILELLANGASFEEIVAGYAFLEREDIYAAIEYARIRPATPFYSHREVLSRQSIARRARSIAIFSRRGMQVGDTNRNDYVVIGKDGDFFYLANAPGAKGQFIWIRFGNCRTKPLLTRIWEPVGKSGIRDERRRSNH